jgi:hypothetical protein
LIAEGVMRAIADGWTPYFYRMSLFHLLKILLMPDDSLAGGGDLHAIDNPGTFSSVANTVLRRDIPSYLATS